jgi:hypothetical protein
MMQSTKVSDCDRITSDMRGLSHIIILGNSQRSENTQIHHIQAYNTIYEVQVQLLHIRFKFMCLQEVKLQKIEQSLWKWFSHHKAHSLHPRRECPSSIDLSLWVLVGNPTLIGLDLPLTPLFSITRRRKVPTCTQKIYSKRKAWGTMLCKTYLSWPKSHETRHAKASNEITDSKPTIFYF